MEQLMKAAYEFLFFIGCISIRKKSFLFAQGNENGDLSLQKMIFRETSCARGREGLFALPHRACDTARG